MTWISFCEMDCSGELDSCLCVPCMLARMPGADKGVKWPTWDEYNNAIFELEKQIIFAEEEGYAELEDTLGEVYRHGWVPNDFEQQCMKYYQVNR